MYAKIVLINILKNDAFISTCVYFDIGLFQHRFISLNDRNKY